MPQISQIEQCNDDDDEGDEDDNIIDFNFNLIYLQNQLISQTR